MTKTRKVSYLAAGCVAASAVLALVAYATLPSTVPVHFDAGGRADDWGPSWVVLAMPVVMALLLAVMVGFTGWAAREKPQHVATMRTLQATVLGIFFGLNGVVVSTMASIPLPTGSISFAVAGALFMAGATFIPRLGR